MRVPDFIDPESGRADAGVVGRAAEDLGVVKGAGILLKDRESRMINTLLRVFRYL